MIFLFTIIILALVFDYINGFHDAAISIATIVSTKVLTPFQAVLWAAIFNFAAKAIPLDLERLLKKAGVTREEVDRFLRSL